MQVLKNEIKQNIIDAAKELFLKHGFEKTSMNAISKQAKVSKSNMYNYFQTKEDIFYHITEKAANEILNVLSYFIDHRFRETFGSEEFIAMMAQKIFKISSENREEILLVMDSSKSTKYENLKLRVIELIEIHFKDDFIKTNSEKDFFITHIIAFNLVEGILEILRNKNNNIEIYDNINKLIKYHVKGSEMLING